MLDTASNLDLLLAFGLPGHGEWLLLVLLGLLIFGKRLPEVGRSLGRGIVEFKRGIKGIEDDLEEESSRSSDRLEHRPAESMPGEPRGAEPAAVSGTAEQTEG